MAFLRIHKPTEKNEIGYFAPRTWDFWRASSCASACAAFWGIGSRCPTAGSWIAFSASWPTTTPCGPTRGITLLGLRIRRGVHDAAHRAFERAVDPAPQNTVGRVSGITRHCYSRGHGAGAGHGLAHQPARSHDRRVPLLGQLPTAGQRVRPGVARERLLHRTGGHDICMGHLPTRLRGFSRLSPKAANVAFALIIIASPPA